MTDDTQQDPLPQKSLPFNNLYLISGLVHGFNQAWMYVFTILFTLLGYFGYQLLLMVPLLTLLKKRGYSEAALAENPSILFSSEALGLDKNLLMALMLGMFIAGLFGFLLGLRWLHRKPLLSVLTGYQRFRLGRFVFAFAVWGSLIVAVTLFSYFSNQGGLSLSFDPTGFSLSLLIMLLMMPLQTGMEELLFRGYLLQGLSQVFRNGIIPLLLTSLFFGMAHLSNPEVQKHGWPIMLTYYCVFALFMGGLTLLDEGIELAFGIHFANNLVSGLLVSSPNSVLRSYSVFEAQSEDPYSEIVLWAFMAGLTFLLFWLRYRWKNFKLIIK